MALSTSIRILCFGDSLTAGWSKTGGDVYHPYAVALKASLEESFPKINITTDIQGLNGDKVISPPGGFLPRMDILYAEGHQTDPYDWAVILGGTNDISWRFSPDDIYASLQKVWDIPLSHGTKVLAVTVPECGNCGSWFTDRVDALNKKIRTHTHENLHVFDLHSQVPYKNMPPGRRKEIWDDDIHFTNAGYDLIGRLAAARLTGLIKMSENLPPPPRKELKKRSEADQRSVEDRLDAVARAVDTNGIA